jgi:hypothetical protein
MTRIGIGVTEQREPFDGERGAIGRPRRGFDRRAARAIVEGERAR